MVKFPTEIELEDLKNVKSDYCLSIYVPHIDRNSIDNPNRIQFKNLLHEAESSLIENNANPKQIRKILKTAKQLLDNNQFWLAHQESLALFMNQNLYKRYLLPDEDIPYMMSLGNKFDLSPLISTLSNDQGYFLLALSHNSVNLYRGGHYQIKPIKLKNFPTNMKESLHIDEFPKSTEKRGVSYARGSSGKAEVHGQYTVSQTDKKMLLEFFRLIDKRLHPFLSKDSLPLVLGGTNYLLPLYRRINTYPHLLKQGLTGNLEHTDKQVIMQKAWQAIKAENRVIPKNTRPILNRAF